MDVVADPPCRSLRGDASPPSCTVSLVGHACDHLDLPAGRHRHGRSPAVRRGHRRHRPAGVGRRQLVGGRAADAAGVPAARPTDPRVRRRRQPDRHVPAPEQPADRPRRHPRARAPRLPRRRGPRVLHAQRGQRPQPGPRRAVQRRLGLPAAGRLDDHDAGRQERVPRRHRSRLPLQGAADPLRDDAGEPVHQGRDPRALPQHRLLRQQRLRRAGGGRGVLRQDRRPADVHRGGVPRRARALAVRATTRSTTPSAAVPASPRSSTSSSTPAR